LSKGSVDRHTDLKWRSPVCRLYPASNYRICRYADQSYQKSNAQPSPDPYLDGGEPKIL